MNRKYHVENQRKRIIPLTLAIALLVLTTSQVSSFELFKPAMAAQFSNMRVIPSTNLVNEKATYDFFFTTATTGTIRNITILFPSGFQTFEATKLIERSGIGSGNLTTLPGPNPNQPRLVYVVKDPVSIPAGTEIRLEIGTIINRATAGSTQVAVVTFGPSNNVIDVGRSAPFTIKDITSTDVSQNFMIRKTLMDVPEGHAMGWNPNGSKKSFLIEDGDLNGNSDSNMVTLYIGGSELYRDCHVDSVFPSHSFFTITCGVPPNDTSQLHYMITKLPPHVIGNSSSTSSLPFDSLDDNESSTRGSQISPNVP